MTAQLAKLKCVSVTCTTAKQLSAQNPTRTPASSLRLLECKELHMQCLRGARHQLSRASSFSALSVCVEHNRLHVCASGEGAATGALQEPGSRRQGSGPQRRLLRRPAGCCPGVDQEQGAAGDTEWEAQGTRCTGGLLYGVLCCVMCGVPVSCWRCYGVGCYAA